MKGIILAGGLGSRLRPLTKVTNKHLLPIYDRPMIYYPLQTLCNAGIDEIMIVTGGNSAGDFLRLLGNGRDFGLPHIAYTYQEGEGGIADALKLCEHFVGGDRVVVDPGRQHHPGRHHALRRASSRPSPRAAGCCSSRSTIPSASASRTSTATRSWASPRSPRRPRATSR